jgi:hypothetical protein
MVYTQYIEDEVAAYLLQLKRNERAWEIKKSLMNCKSCESMRMGYELMGQINLDFCELGLTDCLSAIKTFETMLNGEDKNSDS